MRTMTVALLSLTMLSAAMPAMAQNTGAPAPSGTQEIRFGDELVQGSLVRPDTTSVRGRRASRGPTLLQIREHFVPEMLKSVENL